LLLLSEKSRQLAQVQVKASPEQGKEFREFAESERDPRGGRVGSSAEQFAWLISQKAYRFGRPSVDGGAADNRCPCRLPIKNQP
jgi:hypothetical protein